MRLNFVKNIILGALLSILLLVSCFSIISSRSLSQNLTSVIELQLPVREKLTASKDFLLSANFNFHEIQENDYSTDDQILPLLLRIQTAAAQIDLTSSEQDPQTQPETKFPATINRILGMLEPVLNPKAEYFGKYYQINIYPSLVNDLQSEFIQARNSLRLLFEYEQVNNQVANAELYQKISLLLNILDSQVNIFVNTKIVSIEEVIKPLDLCYSNIIELNSLSKKLGFSPENQTQIDNLLTALNSYKSAVLLYDDEIQLDVSGSNLSEITLLVYKSQQEAISIFEALREKLLVNISTIQQQAINSLEHIQYLYILLSVTAVFLSFGLSIWFNYFLNKRFEHLVMGANKIGQGQLDFRFNNLIHIQDHFGSLALVLNKMAAKLQTRESLLTDNIDALARTQKLVAIGSLAGGIAHDFNNILTAIMGYTELVQSEIPESETNIHNDLSVIISSSQRARDLIRQLLSFSRQGDDGEKVPLELPPIIHESMKLLKATSSASIDISYHINDTCIVIADPTQVYQILTNIGTNAAQAMETKGGKLEVRMSEVTLSWEEVMAHPHMQPGRYALITISDTGPGISQEHINRVFDPYFTTKEFGKGTGMGLFVAYGIAQKHGGIIKVKSNPGHGAIFDILLPTTDAASLKARNNFPQAHTLPRGNEKILIADDEVHIREVGKRIMEEFGYSVKVAEDGQEAFELFKQDTSYFDLVITDQAMPKMTGIELVEKIKKIRQGLPIIMITGYSEYVPKDKAIKAGVKQYLLKPFDRQILKRIRAVLDESKKE